MVNGMPVTTGDTGTCAQHCCCHGNSKGPVDGVIIRWSKWWVVGGRDGVQGAEDELRYEADGMRGITLRAQQQQR